MQQSSKQTAKSLTIWIILACLNCEVASAIAADIPSTQDSSLKADGAPKNDGLGQGIFKHVLEKIFDEPAKEIGSILVLTAISAVGWAGKRWHTLWKAGKRATIALQEKVNAVPSQESYDPFKSILFKRTVDATSKSAQEFAVGAKVIVVASGKGGVGKSTIALGLLESYSRFDRTLLVDFDMHNRGLSSLLRPQLGQASAATSVLSLMEEFHQKFAKSDLAKLVGIEESDTAFSHFDNLRRTFAHLPYHQMIPMHHFDGGAIMVKDPVQNSRGAILPQRAFFLPSTTPPQLFLSSPDVFTAGFLEVFYFIKCLAYWAASAPNMISTIILDCHGAHDLFMVGAIHAAADLLIVTTPDPGGFDGTFDLILFAETLRKHVPASLSCSIVAINHCRNFQKETREVLENFLERQENIARPNATVRIDSREDIGQIMTGYHFGAVAKRSSIWRSVCEITQLFQKPPDRYAKGKTHKVDSPPTTSVADTDSVSSQGEK